jgi:hypothetical protein
LAASLVSYVADVPDDVEATAGSVALGIFYPALRHRKSERDAILPSLGCALAAKARRQRKRVVRECRAASLGARRPMGMAILVSERPYAGANGALFPEFHAGQSRFLAPSICSLESARSMRMTLFEMFFAHDAWLWLLA